MNESFLFLLVTLYSLNCEEILTIYLSIIFHYTPMINCSWLSLLPNINLSCTFSLTKFSSNCNFHLLHLSCLFLCKFSKEFYFLFIGWFPIIISLECTLQMLFNVYIKCLRLNLRIWRIIYTWNCSCGWKMMQICS